MNEELRKVIQTANYTIQDLYDEIQSREDYHEFVHFRLIDFSNDELKEMITLLEREE